MKNERSFTLPIAVALGVTVVLMLLLPLFAAPIANMGPRDLPVGVAGAGAAQFARQLDPNAFEVATVQDPDAAIRGREVYAVFVVEPDGITLRTATSASPTVAAMLIQAAQQAAAAQQVRVQLVDHGDLTAAQGGGDAGDRNDPGERDGVIG